MDFPSSTTAATAAAAPRDEEVENSAAAVASAATITKPSPELLVRLQDYISTLRPISGCSFNLLYLHNNCYIPKLALLPALLAPHVFRPRPSDVLLATLPKSGTTWLKALLFATIHRDDVPYSSPDHPLTRHSPHELAPVVEYIDPCVTADDRSTYSASARHQLFQTHLPAHLLPQEAFGCRVVYLCREPKDCFVSLAHFLPKFRAQIGEDPDRPLEADFEAFCCGASFMGPYWDHILGYWGMREKVLFLEYEEMMADPVGSLRWVAEFIERPFTEEEEEEGVAEGIVRLCGFEQLSGMEVNRSGVMKARVGDLENNIFYRKARVGDWVNHISPEMGRRLDEITESKFQGTGPSFRWESGDSGGKGPS